MFKLRQDRVPIFGTFFGHWAEEFFFETTQILEPFWFFFWGREPHQVTTFYRWPDYLAAPVWPEESILWLSADETNLSRVGLRRRWGTLSPRGGGLQYVSICSSFCRVATAEMAMRRWVRTFKRRFGISRSGVPLAEPVSEDHVQAKAGPGSNFWDFFWPLGRRILLETTQILEPFWFFFWGREPHQVTTFYRWPDYLAAPVWPEESILWLSADETNLSRVGLRRRWGTLSPRGGGLQ